MYGMEHEVPHALTVNEIKASNAAKNEMKAVFDGELKCFRNC